MWLLRGRFSQTTPEAEVDRPQNARLSCFGPILLALSITRRDWTKKPDVHNRSVCRANTFAARRSSLCASVQQQHRSVSSTYNLGNKDPFLFVFFFLYFPFFSFFFFFHPFFLLSSPHRECSSPILTFKQKPLPPYVLYCVSIQISTPTATPHQHNPVLPFFSLSE